MIADAVLRYRAEKPEGHAVVDAGGASTWDEVATRATRWAEELRGEPTEILGVVVPESGAALSLVAACIIAERRVVLVPSPYASVEPTALMSLIGVRRLYTARGEELIELGSLASTPEVAVAFDSPVALMTSGSTGRPKLVCHTWDTLGGAVSTDERWANRRWLVGYPLAHFAGLQVVAQAITTGGTLVVPKDFTPAAAREAMKAAAPTQLNCTPTYVRRLLMELRPEEWATSTLTQITLGGEAVDQRLLDSVRERLPGCKVTHIYASTELGAAIVVRDGKAGFSRALLANGRLKVVDGELWALRDTSRGMLRYAGREEPASEWLPTGDLVEVGEDRVHFTGRIDDTINVGGFKVSPAIVENVIREIAGVDDVCVSAKASAIVGNLLKAVIVSTAPDKEALRAQIEKGCAERLPYYMQPRIYIFADELPTTPSQKVLRRAGSKET